MYVHCLKPNVTFTFVDIIKHSKISRKYLHVNKSI